MSQEPATFEDRVQKLNKLREGGTNPYPYTYEISHTAQAILQAHEGLQAGEQTDVEVRIAGRLMTKRDMGKLCFAHVQDQTGQIQILLSVGDVGKEMFDVVTSLYDLGDIVGVVGKVCATKKGELSVRVSQIELLTKSLRPLPDKFHGLKDQEIRYRHRSLDLISNPQSREVFVLRSKLITFMRKFLGERDFLEVETPILQAQYGGAAARPFITHHNTLDLDLYLRISPELFLKRLVVGGLERVFDFNKNFRNEGIDYNHNPEFSMVEIYQAYADYNDMMELTESLLKALASEVVGKQTFEYRGHSIDLSKPFTRLRMTDGIKQITGLDCLSCSDDAMKEKLLQEKVEVPAFAGRGWLINALFETFVEETLVQPTFILDYPEEISPLTKKHRELDGFVERFELFIGGSEFANAYSELNDPLDQRERFAQQAKAKEQGDDEANPIDHDFMYAIEVGMPPTGGLGIGVDRVIMLLTEQSSIRDVILFPTMRPKQ